jgi:hypothetical protein
VDLEAVEAELERQRLDFAQQQAAQPLGNDNNARTCAPSTLCFPRVAYNMAAASCQLEDISNMSDLKTNERQHEAKQLLQAKSSASRHYAALSRLSQPTTTTNGDHSNAHALTMGGSGGDSSGSSSGRPWTRGTKPQQERRHEPSPRHPPMHH